jgi:hypothetical protein
MTASIQHSPVSNETGDDLSNAEPIPYELTDEGLAELEEPWHYVRKTAILEAAVNGVAAGALCGDELSNELVTPGARARAGSNDRMLCVRCEAIYATLPSGASR